MGCGCGKKFSTPRPTSGAAKMATPSPSGVRAAPNNMAQAAKVVKSTGTPYSAQRGVTRRSV